VERQGIRADIERVEMAVESALFDCVGRNFHNLSVMPEPEGDARAGGRHLLFVANRSQRSAAFAISMIFFRMI